MHAESAEDLTMPAHEALTPDPDDLLIELMSEPQPADPYPLQDRVVLGLPVVGHHRDRMADHLGERPAEQLLGSPVPLDDPLVDVQDNDGVRHRGHHCLGGQGCRVESHLRHGAIRNAPHEGN